MEASRVVHRRIREARDGFVNSSRRLRVGSRTYATDIIIYAMSRDAHLSVLERLSHIARLKLFHLVSIGIFFIMQVGLLISFSQCFSNADIPLSIALGISSMGEEEETVQYSQVHRSGTAR